MDIQYDKYADGLAPAIIQDSATAQVLMLGFMNADALEKTRDSGLVTFYSRSRRQLWTKGETSGNFLRVDEIFADCDSDTLLIKAKPDGPVCHTGSATCFSGDVITLYSSRGDTLFKLEKVIDSRAANPAENSYTSELLGSGINRIAQKVGEEAIELVIEAKDDNIDSFKSEAADLLFHLLVLLRAKDVRLSEVTGILDQRRR